jgi:hypothetical protein
MFGSTTLSIAATAIAASNAFPPFLRTAIPASAARGLAALTSPFVPMTGAGEADRSGDADRRGESRMEGAPAPAVKQIVPASAQANRLFFLFPFIINYLIAPRSIMPGRSSPVGCSFSNASVFSIHPLNVKPAFLGSASRMLLPEIEPHLTI